MLLVFGMRFRVGMSLSRLAIPKALWRLASKSLFFMYLVYIWAFLFLLSECFSFFRITMGYECQFS